MKRFSYGLCCAALLTASLPALSMAAGTSPQAPERTLQQELRALRGELSPAQRASLAAVLPEWQALSQRSSGELRQRVEADAARIFTPSQRQQFLRLVGQGLQFPYLPAACIAAAGGGLVLSASAALVCPSPDSGAATYQALAAASYAGVCTVEGADECPDAAEWAGLSASTWLGLTPSCNSAYVAFASMEVAYLTCGGEL